MTPDQEYNIHGYIDRRGRVLSKFRYIRRGELKEKLEEMRHEAQSKASIS